jgi:hypothetical protein
MVAVFVVRVMLVEVKLPVYLVEAPSKSVTFDPVTSQLPLACRVSPFGFPPVLYSTIVVWAHPESVTTSVPETREESANAAGNGLESAVLRV